MTEMGRPTLYRPEYCDRVIELGREGRSKAQMASRLDVCCNTLDNWAAEHDEFLKALTRARDLAKAWWEDKGQDNLTAQTFQTGLWSRSMAARFPDDYTERRQQEVTGKNGGPIQQEVTATVRPTLTRDEWLKAYVDTPAGAATSGD